MEAVGRQRLGCACKTAPGDQLIAARSMSTAHVTSRIEIFSSDQNSLTSGEVASAGDGDRLLVPLREKAAAGDFAR